MAGEEKVWFIVAGYGFSSYMLRTSLGFIAVSMVNEFQHSSDVKSGDQKALLLSAFYIGYASNNLLGGVMASKFGGLRILLISCIGWSICATTLPTVFDINDGSTLSTWLTMVLMGACCGPLFPASQVALSRNSNSTNISLAASFRSIGCFSASIISSFATPLLLPTIGWRAVFQLYGSLGLVIVALSKYYKVTSDSEVSIQKATAAFSKDESERLLLLSSGTPATVSLNEGDEKWMANERKLICSPPVISAITCHVAANLSFYTLLSYMPTYFIDVLDIPMEDTGFYIVPCRIGMLLGVGISGYITKYILDKKMFTLLQTRRNGACLCLIAVSILQAMVPLVKSASTAAMLLCLASIFHGAFDPLLHSTYIDMSPDYAGFLCGFGNTFATIPGAIGPFIVMFLLHSYGSWSYVFWFMAASIFFAAIFHYKFGDVFDVLKKSLV